MTAAPDSQQLGTVRAFNRDVTRAIGVLSGNLYGTEFVLSEARVLHDLAHRDETPVSELRDALDLDSGYLSRLLAGLEERGVIARERSPHDRRRQVARLTPTGRDVVTVLGARADEAATDLLAPLSGADRERLVRAMADVSAVLGTPTETDSPRTVVLRAAGPGDWGWIVSRHGALYSEEFGWDERFEALIARIVADHIEERDPRREAAWIAELDGERAGCILCVRTEDTAVAKLRLLLVEPSARGTGIGRELVHECIRFARRAGYERLMLWTNSPLTGARRIYDAAGFRLTGEEEHQDFGPPMKGQTMELAL